MIIFWNFVVDFGWLVLFELGGDGIVLVWLEDDGGGEINFCWGILLILMVLFMKGWFVIRFWWWWLCGIDGGLGMMWSLEKEDCLLWRVFLFKEVCFFFEKFWLGCLWWEREKKSNF